MTILQKATIGAALLAALGICMVQTHQNSRLTEQIQALQQEQRSATARLNALEQEHKEAKQQLSALPHNPQPPARPETPAKAPPRVAEGAALPSVGLEDQLDRACAETSPGKREATLQHAGGQGQCPAAIAEMLDAIGNAELTRQHGVMLASVWLSRDAAAARAWIERSALPDEDKQRLLSRPDQE